MNTVKVCIFKKPADLLYKSVKIYMKDGGAFYFKVTEATPDQVGGFDDEGLNLRIDLKDIDFILGGN